MDNVEIERKFLIDKNIFTSDGLILIPFSHHYNIGQGYLFDEDSDHCHRVMRIRVQDGQGFLTYKNAPTGSLTRVEIENQVDISFAMSLLNECSTFIEKTRYVVNHNNHVWEIDYFRGSNEGLIVAEIELQSEDEAFDKPEWVLEEVTNDVKYCNNNLCKFPFKQWDMNVLELAINTLDLDCTPEELYINWNPLLTDGAIYHIVCNNEYARTGTFICHVSDLDRYPTLRIII